MDWGFGQIHDVALNILLGLACAALAYLFVVVWREVPEAGTYRQRFWAGIRKTRWLSAALAGVLIVCIAVVVTGWMLGPPQSTDEQPAASTPMPTPSTSVGPRPLAGAGWGPARDLVSVDSRPTEVIFNSAVDHPTYGDERNFMRVRPADEESAVYADSVVVEPGKVYEFLVAINNDVKEGGETAEDVQLRVQLPGIAVGSAPSYAFVSSSNARPDAVWDGATLVGVDTENEFAIRYVQNSAVLHTGGDANGTVLSNDLFTDGVSVGCEALDGAVPAGARCQSWVTFRMHIDQPNFEASALAQLDGATNWSETAVVSPGQRLRVLLTYRNTGTTVQNEVMLRAALPANVHYLQGSSMSSTSGGQKVPVTSDRIVGEGLDLGSHAPGAEVQVEFEVIVDEAPTNDTNVQELDEFLTVATQNGVKHAPLILVWL